MEKSDIKEVATKGFTIKWWRDHRSSACKGSGVAKALDKLVKRGMSPSGMPDKIKPEDSASSVPLYTDLLTAFTKALGKCGKHQQETRDALVIYKKQANKALDIVEKMARAYDGNPDEEPKKKENKVDAKLEKAKNEAAAQLTKITKHLSEIEKVLKPIPKAMTEGEKHLKSLVANYISSIGQEGPDQSKTYLKGLDGVIGSIKMNVHVKTLKSSLATLNKLASMLDKIDKKLVVEKDFKASAKLFKSAKASVSAAQKSVVTTQKIYKL